ncbi:hypothetical protein ACH5RR_040930 [Cinchona calisaya]|uniref:Uncharacterized protein n=1 Tax=Cinchona calisaya TaxID=153742 RepID=A0ABD2XXI5_9GENT
MAQTKKNPSGQARVWQPKSTSLIDPTNSNCLIIPLIDGVGFLSQEPAHHLVDQPLPITNKLPEQIDVVAEKLLEHQSLDRVELDDVVEDTSLDVDPCMERLNDDSSKSCVTHDLIDDRQVRLRPPKENMQLVMKGSLVGHYPTVHVLFNHYKTGIVFSNNSSSLEEL